MILSLSLNSDNPDPGPCQHLITQPFEQDGEILRCRSVLFEGTGKRKHIPKSRWHSLRSVYSKRKGRHATSHRLLRHLCSYRCPLCGRNWFAGLFRLPNPIVLPERQTLVECIASFWPYLVG